MNKYKHVHNASIKEIACREYAYGEDLTTEIYLSKMETKWAIIAKSIIDDNDIDDNTDLTYNDLLLFISLSMTRTAKIADMYNEFMSYFENEFNAIKQSGRELAFDEEEFFKERQTPNKIPMEIATDSVDILNDLIPLIIKNNTNRYFITTDNPVTLYNQLYVTRKYRVNYGTYAVGLQIFITLSPHICLCLFDPLVYNVKLSTDFTVEINSISQINEINKMIAMNSYKCLFYNNLMDRSYIQKLASYKKKPSSNIKVLDTNLGAKSLIKFGDDSIHANIQLPIFTIKDLYILHSRHHITRTC